MQVLRVGREPRGPPKERKAQTQVQQQPQPSTQPPTQAPVQLPTQGKARRKVPTQAKNKTKELQRLENAERGVPLKFEDGVSALREGEVDVDEKYTDFCATVYPNVMSILPGDQSVHLSKCEYLMGRRKDNQQYRPMVFIFCHKSLETKIKRRLKSHKDILKNYEYVVECEDNQLAAVDRAANSSKNPMPVNRKVWGIVPTLNNTLCGMKCFLDGLPQAENRFQHPDFTLGGLIAVDHELFGISPAHKFEKDLGQEASPSTDPNTSVHEPVVSQGAPNEFGEGEEKSEHCITGNSSFTLLI